MLWCFCVWHVVDDRRRGARVASWCPLTERRPGGRIPIPHRMEFYGFQSVKECSNGLSTWTDFTVAGRRYWKHLGTTWCTSLDAYPRPRIRSTDRKCVLTGSAAGVSAAIVAGHDLEILVPRAAISVLVRARGGIVDSRASVFCAAVVAANTSMRPVEVKHLRRWAGRGGMSCRTTMGSRGAEASLRPPGTATSVAVAAGRDERGGPRTRVHQRSSVALDAGALLAHPHRPGTTSARCPRCRQRNMAMAMGTIQTRLRSRRSWRSATTHVTVWFCVDPRLPVNC